MTYEKDACVTRMNSLWSPPFLPISRYITRPGSGCYIISNK